MSERFKRETSLGWLVNVVARSMAQELDSLLKAQGLSLKLWPTLMCLWEQEGLTQAELARAVWVPEYTTTRVLDSLEADGLIERRADPRSRRSYRIHLTAQGRDLHERLVPLAMAVNAQHLAPLDEAEAEQLGHLLTKIIQNLQPS
ncbi:MAG: MarR family transcriptional regulator [Deltaproteobacteria bacterium]|nr:MarR family transcriptional regulator [Deltaproteobacteria bacterium]